jgi:hypothetical protein
MEGMKHEKESVGDEPSANRIAVKKCNLPDNILFDPP